MSNGRSSSIRDFVKREKISLLERRNNLLQVVAEAFNKEIERLDDFELRYEKESLATPLPSPNEPGDLPPA